MFYYFVKFKLANDMKAEKIALDDHQMEFDDAAKHFNMVGENARVYKKIIRQHVTPTYLEIVFECANKIENPTLCFRKYSKFLIDTFQLGDWATASGNFLRGIESKEISENEALGNIKESEKKDEEISDLEMLKQILDICFANSVENAEERKKRQRTINKIKLLLKEYRA